jgi:RNA polymerase nonessential primary-like sigma factor
MNATEHTSRTTDSMRAYLSEIGRFPLLSHAEEITLGKQVQQLMSLVETRESLVERLGREPEPEEWATEAVLTVDELQTLVRQGELAKRRMIETNLRLVVSVAKKYQKHNVDLLDLIQEGGIGLQKGIEKFDPTKGYRLSTYIYWWIRQAVTRAIAEKGRTIRLSFQMSENLIKLRQAQRELFQTHGRQPTIPELAAALDRTPSYIQNLLEKSDVAESAGGQRAGRRTGRSARG